MVFPVLIAKIQSESGTRSLDRIETLTENVGKQSILVGPVGGLSRGPRSRSEMSHLETAKRQSICLRGTDRVTRF